MTLVWEDGANETTIDCFMCSRLLPTHPVHGPPHRMNNTSFSEDFPLSQSAFLTNDKSSPEFDRKQGTKHSDQHLKEKLFYSNVSPKEQMLLHANSKVMSVALPQKQLHVWSNAPTRSTSSLARLPTRCACFVMVMCSCHHMPVGLHNIVMEHGVGTHRFCSTSCSALDLASFPLGCTSVLGLEFGIQFWFVDWITGEIAPLSCWLTGDGLASWNWVAKCLTPISRLVWPAFGLHWSVVAFWLWTFVANTKETRSVWEQACKMHDESIATLMNGDAVLAHVVGVQFHLCNWNKPQGQFVAHCKTQINKFNEMWPESRISDEQAVPMFQNVVSSTPDLANVLNLCCQSRNQQVNPSRFPLMNTSPFLPNTVSYTHLTLPTNREV